MLRSCALIWRSRNLKTMMMVMMPVRSLVVDVVGVRRSLPRTYHTHHFAVRRTGVTGLLSPSPGFVRGYSTIEVPPPSPLPPPPSHNPNRGPTPSRARKYGKRMIYLTLGLGTIYIVDKYYNASAISRNLRTLWTCAVITFDYKLNFTPEKTEKIPELHERVAQRVYDLLTSNGGLYIKIGQAIGANAAVLPKPMQIKFSSLFDDAPQIPYSTIRQVFIREFGQPPEVIFEVFEEKAMASASIAQVHKAKLWGNGKEEWVAVKVQKPDVGRQMEWDLGAYRAVMWMFENWAFDLPVYFVVDFVADHLRQELDFEREAENARRTAIFVENEPRLRGKVYIPKVYPEYTTKRVMTAEWIDGVRLSDRKGIRRLVGEEEPDEESAVPIAVASSPSSSSTNANAAGVTFNNLPSSSLPTATTTTSSFVFPPKPLKGGTKEIMQIMVELFSAQMFEWGWVHCDPHPGNVVIRPSPTATDLTTPQLVLLDHGLYVQVPEDFRKDWVRLWRGMLSGDFGEVEGVTKGWGIGMPDMMASFTLMKPVVLRRNRGEKQEEEEKGVGKGKGEEGKEKKPLTQYEISVRMKEKLRGFLEDTDRMPKVLIFLTRNMRMVQGNNQSLGSPVNRIKITGYWASRSQYHNPNYTLRERVKGWWHHIIFRTVMLSLDISFWRTKVLSWLWSVKIRLFGGDGKGRKKNFEEELERNMRDFAREELGIDVGEEVFAG